MDTPGEWQLPISILLPHYELDFFNDRVFQIEFDKKKMLELKGKDFLKLTSNSSLTRNLVNINL